MELEAAISALGDLDARPDAIHRIEAAGANAIPALRVGLSHPYWRVRHMCARLLDDLPLDDATLATLRSVARDDSHRKVRAQAYHAAGCEPCKPDGAASCEADGMGMLGEMIDDRSIRVRRAAATGLLIGVATGRADPEVSTLLVKLADEDDATISKRVNAALELLEATGDPKATAQRRVGLNAQT